MEPLTWQEYLELHDEKPLPDSNCIAQLLSDGKLPSHHRMYQRPLSMYLDYLHNRDIIEALTITDPNYIPQSVLPKILDRELIIDATGRDDVHFSAIAKRLLQKNANEINLHTIASEEQTSIYQIKKALELGKKLFFWDLLEGKQKVKLYTTSTTLSHHARTSFSPTIDNDGLLFENKIFQRLRKITKNIHYYRKNNQELDFILNETVGIECKLGNLGNYKKYITIAEKENLKQLLIIGQEEIRLIQHENLKIWILPWWIV
jgi:predicted AAA+ superfamily ATPase